MDPAAYRCPRCLIYFCFKCRRRVQQRGHASPINLERGADETGLGGVRRGGVDPEHAIGQRFARVGAGTRQPAERRSCRVGHRYRCKTIEDPVERNLPGRVAPPGQAIHDRQLVLVEEVDLFATRQRAGGQTVDDVRLCADQRGDEPEIVGQ